MKKMAYQVFVLWPFIALCVAVTPITLLFGILWEKITCRKAEVISDNLYIKGAPIDITQIETLMIHAYSVGNTFKLKFRNNRPIGLIPTSGKDLFAWAKRRGVPVQLAGEKWAMEKFK